MRGLEQSLRVAAHFRTLLSLRIKRLLAMEALEVTGRLHALAFIVLAELED
jgi:hypothetical protein